MMQMNTFYFRPTGDGKWQLKLIPSLRSGWDASFPLTSPAQGLRLLLLLPHNVDRTGAYNRRPSCWRQGDCVFNVLPTSMEPCLCKHGSRKSTLVYICVNVLSVQLPSRRALFGRAGKNTEAAAHSLKKKVV